jgi:acetyl esterase/lipase
MFRKIGVGCILILLIRLCTSCLAPPPSPNFDSPPAGDSIDGDTSVISRPDTIIKDTTQIINPDLHLGKSLRFGSSYLFEEAGLDRRSGFYSKANDFIGRPVNLDYAFIAPAVDTMKHRPFILMVHEGAFLFGALENEMGKARLLARKGYAAASINYRLGFNGGSELNACGGNNREIVQAVYRAVQDTYAALHYFAERADEFAIDPGQFILSGSSAGSITITALMYMNEADFEALQPGITKTLGKLDPNPNGSSFNVKALLSYLGYGIFKSSYINTSNALPTVFFQRTGDTVLPYQKGTFLSCPNYLSSEGAKPVSDVLKKLKVPYELNYQPESGHILSYTEEYVTNRYAQFMKRLWSGNRRQIVNENIKTVEDVAIK